MRARGGRVTGVRGNRIQDGLKRAGWVAAVQSVMAFSVIRWEWLTVEELAILTIPITCVAVAMWGRADGPWTSGAATTGDRIVEYVGQTGMVRTPGMGDAVRREKAGILEIADGLVCNKADHPGENELVRDLRDISGSRPVFETIATHGQGIGELLDGLTI